MSKVKKNQIDIKSDTKHSAEIKVTPFDVGHAPVVKEFTFEPIKYNGEGTYHSVKAKFGPLAATDPERLSRTQKDRRFQINPLLREPLSIEQEERRVIEEKVRARIAALAEEAKTQASEVGYQDGLKKGYEDAYKKFVEDASVRVNQFEQFIVEMNQAKEEIFRANERFLIELVFRISKLVILKELAVDRDYVLRLAKELINRAGVRDNITLKIHPEEAKTIDTLKEGLLKTFGEMANLNIEASTQVKRGGCQIETQWNAIDATVESQLDGIYRSLVSKRLGGN